MTVVRATSVNPVVLSWARERAGITSADLGARLGCDAERVEAWEQASEVPTYRQLQELARYLRRPLAIFFFESPPDEPDDGEEFRLSASDGAGADLADTRYAIREVRARQIRIAELTGGMGGVGDSSLFRRTGVSAKAVRKALGVSFKEQESWASAEDAFKAWRLAVEGIGVAVFKRSYKQKEISGLSVWDPVVPAISINNGTTWNRQVFTLFHELAHLLKRRSGTTRADEAALPAGDELEWECNRFAADILLPETGLGVAKYSGLRSLEVVAKRLHVSREVVLRRLLDDGIVTASQYRSAMSRLSRDLFLREKGSVSGGNFYATVAAYLGPSYLRLAFSALHRRAIDLYEAADALGVRPRQVAELERFVGGVAP